MANSSIHTFKDSIDVTPSSWTGTTTQTIDIKAQLGVPSTACGAIIVTSGASGNTGLLYAYGSLSGNEANETCIGEAFQDSRFCYIGLNGDDIQVRKTVGGDTYLVHLLGYFDESGVYFESSRGAALTSGSGSWANMDLTARFNAGALNDGGNVEAAILVYRTDGTGKAAPAVGCRRDGSTEPTGTVAILQGARHYICGVHSSTDIVELYRSTAHGAGWHLHGWILKDSGTTVYTNPSSETLVTTYPESNILEDMSTHVTSLSRSILVTREGGNFLQNHDVKADGGSWGSIRNRGGGQNMSVIRLTTAQKIRQWTAGSADHGDIRVWGYVDETRIIDLTTGTDDLAFGDHEVGDSPYPTEILKIKNNGNVDLTVSSITYPNAVFSGSWSSGVIAPGATQEVTITFTPLLGQLYSGNVQVNADDTSGSDLHSISGTGTTSTRIIDLTNSDSLAFGEVDVDTVSVAQTLKIENNGNDVLTVTDITSSSSRFSVDWTSGTIAAGSFKNVNVTFTTNSPTTYNATLTVIADETSGTDTHSASGTGVSRIIGLTGNLVFGTVPLGNSPTATLTIANTGSRTLTVSSITYPHAEFSGDWSSGTIGAGLDQDVIVTFAPLTSGFKGSSLTVVADETSGVDTHTVTGTGAGGAKLLALLGVG